MLYKIAFSLVRGMGVELAEKFLDILPDEESFFSLPEADLIEITGTRSKILASDYRRAVLEKAKNEIEFIEKNKIETYYFRSESYPKRLLECVDAPIMLFGKGDVNLNSKHVVSIVGTRNATQYGKSVTYDLVASLAKYFPDTVIVSGLAYGIDIAAHRAAVEKELPTVAVLAHGLNTVYPAQHRNFAIEMLKHEGMLLTDYTSQDSIHRANFLARNRIVAGLADCTIVVESAEKGGAMVTASLAMEYDRDVFAVPGRVSDPYSKGCNSLIRRNKAAAFTDVENLLEAMCWNTATENRPMPVNASLFPDISPEEQPVYDFLVKNGTSHVNAIRTSTRLAMHELMSMLVDMEFRGAIKSLPGSFYSL